MAAPPTRRAGAGADRRDTMSYSLGLRTLTPDEHLVVVGGELDMSAAPDLKAAVGTAIDAGVTTLVVDLGEVTFIDSTAIGVLLAARQRLRELGGTLELVCTEPNVLRVLEIVGIRDHLPIHPTRDAALGAVAAAR
jgi:anti-sigma B factor antagonist